MLESNIEYTPNMDNIFKQPETISNNIKYAFNQFELALVGFASYLQLRLQNVIPNIPVFFQNTGDFSYMVNKKFVETKNEDIIQKVPRFVIKLDDIQPNQQENTNQYNKIFYLFEGHAYQAVVRRLCYNVNLTTNFVSSNLITMLNHIEIMGLFASHDNVYTYEFLGNTCQAAFAIQGWSNEFPSIDMGQGGTRNMSTSNNIELQVHLLVPRLESITLADDAKLDRIEYSLISKGYNNNLYQVPSGSLQETDDTELKYPAGSLLTPEDTNIPDDENSFTTGVTTGTDTENCDCSQESPHIKYKAGQKIPRNIPFS